MYDYDPNYYIADGVHNNNKLAMAAPRQPHNYGEPPKKPPFVPYGPKPPVCPCAHHHGEPEKLPPIKRPEHPDGYYEHPPYIPSAETCNCQITNRFPVSNIINVESQLLITLKITLYGVTEEDDKTVILENGKEYTFTYITEDGPRQITGMLRYIDTNISTKCIRYIGENDTTTDQSYIIVDGSTPGNSNIVKIFIRSLRGIDEVKEETPDDSNSDSESESESNSESESESSSESESGSSSETESDSSSESNSETESESSSESESESTSETESDSNSESSSESGSDSSSESETSNSEYTSESNSESDIGSEGNSDYNTDNTTDNDKTETGNDENPEQNTEESSIDTGNAGTLDPQPDTNTTTPDYSNNE